MVRAMSDEKSTDKKSFTDNVVHHWTWFWSHLGAIPGQDWAGLATGAFLGAIPVLVSSLFVPRKVTEANWAIVALSFVYGVVVLIFRVDERDHNLDRKLAKRLQYILYTILLLIAGVALYAALT